MQYHDKACSGYGCYCSSNAKPNRGISCIIRRSAQEKAYSVIAKRDGTSLNQFISMAVAEKISALETEEFFRERAKRADLKMFEEILYRRGGEASREGDEVEK